MVHPLKNILNKLRWDPDENADDYVITYRHRGAPNDAVRIRASRIRKLGKSFFTILDDLDSDAEETTIPFHRIIEIRNTVCSKVIWKTHKRG